MAKDVFARIEMKYVMDGKQYHALRQRLERIAHVDEYGETKICNIYYDTPSYRLIRTSLDRPAYKEKLRLRTYGAPDAQTMSYVEIKKKFEGVVYKRRIGMPYRLACDYMKTHDGMRPFTLHRTDAEEAERYHITEALEQQIMREIDYLTAHYGGLKPMMVITYDRTALIGYDDPELRITFDRNIRWRAEDLDLLQGTSGAPILQGDRYLMELKIAGGMPLPIARALSDLEICQTSFSKYGRAYELLRQREEREQFHTGLIRTQSA